MFKSSRYFQYLLSSCLLCLSASLSHATEVSSHDAIPTVYFTSPTSDFSIHQGEAYHVEVHGEDIMGSDVAFIDLKIDGQFIRR